MFSDNVVSRSSLKLLIFLAIIAYLYLVIVVLFWQLPVKAFGPEPVIGFYKFLGVVVIIFFLLDLFILGPIREEDARKHKKERLEKLKNWRR